MGAGSWNHGAGRRTIGLSAGPLDPSRWTSGAGRWTIGAGSLVQRHSVFVHGGNPGDGNPLGVSYKKISFPY